VINTIEILGRGEIATVLTRAKEQGQLTKNGLYIAQGVGNPNPLPEDQYIREEDSLRSLSRQHRTASQQVIYFSTLSIESQTRYARHKRDMEKLIADLFPNFVIARFGILVGVDKNRFTTVNFLLDKVRRGEPVRIRDTSRDVIDTGEFIHQINNLLVSNGIAEFHGQTMTEREIFDQYVLSSLGMAPPYEHEIR